MHLEHGTFKVHQGTFLPKNFKIDVKLPVLTRQTRWRVTRRHIYTSTWCVLATHSERIQIFSTTIYQNIGAFFLVIWIPSGLCYLGSYKSIALPVAWMNSLHGSLQGSFNPHDLKKEIYGDTVSYLSFGCNICTFR